MSARVAHEPPVGAIGAAAIGALFAIALLWLARPGVTGCAMAAVPPGGGCVSYIESRYAVAGTVVIVLLYAALALVGFRVRPPKRTPALIGLGALILVVFIVCGVLAFSNPIPIPEGVFP